jgi:GT2 family glycosyltransferase
VLAHDYDSEVMLADCFIAPSAVMHHRELVERVGGFDESMSCCYEDWDFYLKAAERYTIARVPGASAIVRLRDDGGNVSTLWGKERAAAARELARRYGTHRIVPKTFWQVAETLDARC